MNNQKNIEKSIFIQIGAGAGDLDSRANNRDGFTEKIKKISQDKIKKIILVEPNPLNITKLKECWKDYQQAEIHQVAIVPNSNLENNIELFYCPDDGPHYQVASIKESHVHKHYGQNCKIEKFVIKAVHLKDFTTSLTNEVIELLAFDIEGVDAEVIMDLNLDEIKIKYLVYEHIHLGNFNDKIIKKLKENGFKYLGFAYDHNQNDSLWVNEKYI